MDETEAYEKAKIIVGMLINDLTSRRGFRQEWDGCSEVRQEEIIGTWDTLVADFLSGDE